MDRAAVLEIVARFRAELERRGIKVEQAVLFGSHGNGTARPDSDIDLVVVSEAFEGKDEWQRIDLMVPALAALMEPIEAIAATPEEWSAGDRAVLQIASAGVPL